MIFNCSVPTELPIHHVTPFSISSVILKITWLLIFIHACAHVSNHHTQQKQTANREGTDRERKRPACVMLTEAVYTALSLSLSWHSWPVCQSHTHVQRTREKECWQETSHHSLETHRFTHINSTLHNSSLFLYMQKALVAAYLTHPLWRIHVVQLLYKLEGNTWLSFLCLIPVHSELANVGFEKLKLLKSKLVVENIPVSCWKP